MGYVSETFEIRYFGTHVLNENHNFIFFSCFKNNLRTPIKVLDVQIKCFPCRKWQFLGVVWNILVYVPTESNLKMSWRMNRVTWRERIGIHHWCTFYVDLENEVNTCFARKCIQINLARVRWMQTSLEIKYSNTNILFSVCILPETRAISKLKWSVISNGFNL